MAIKYKLTAEEHAALPEVLRKEYKKDGDAFVVDLEGAEDTSALKRAKQHEVEARKKAEDALRALQTELGTLTEERDNLLKGAVKKDDVDRLEASYKQKLTTKEKELSERISALTGNLSTLLVDNVAGSLATKLATSPALLLPHIKSRLKAVEENGAFITKVIDHEGKPSALTIQDLEKEILANKDFSPILIGSKGSGSGATGSSGAGGAGSDKVDFKASPKAIAASIRAKHGLPSVS